MKFDLRPMGIGDILDTTFRLYKARFVPFLVISLALYVPMGIVFAWFQTSALAGMEAPRALAHADPEAAAQILRSFLAFVLFVLLYGLVVFPICYGVMVVQVSATYLGENLSGAGAFRRAAPRLLRLLAANFIVGVLNALGYLLLIVPGIIFTLYFILVPAAVVLEGCGVFRSLSRSVELVSGNLGKGFLLGLVVFCLVMAVSAILQGFIFFLPVGEFLKVFLNQVSAALLLPIQTAAFILFYYDLRIRKEAFDLERLAAEAGIPATAAAAPGP